MPVDKRAATPTTGWQAHLTLEFTRVEARTVLTLRRHCGPLLVQRPFYPEGPGVCHVYLLHPPGGVVSGDQLQLQVSVQARAKVLLTAPAANKFYRGPVEAQSIQRLHIAEQAALEWFPHESIFYDGSRTRLETRVTLAADALFSGWEISVFGRPAAMEVFQTGYSRQAFELWRLDRPLWLERAHWHGGSPTLQAAYALSGFTCSGCFVATLQCPQTVAKINSMANTDLEGKEALFSVTQLAELIVCRYVGHSAEEAKRVFSGAWQILRPQMLNRQACLPRIWRT